jgi:hypothetical protein
MTQHAPSTGLVGFHCNSNGRTAYTGVDETSIWSNKS